MKKVINTLQKDIVRIFKSGAEKKPLALCAQDNCSEASRLVAIWIRKTFKKAELFIVKGEYKPRKYHDVLVANLEDVFYLIDPSVWQFFKSKRSILMGTFKSMSDVLQYAKKAYGGKWGSVERLKNIGAEKKLIAIIQRNL